jgi:thioesterase domain-containing protein
MAAHHIDKVRSVQPRGPYLVGGMCAGGVIAFEIARQLQSQGEEVAMVALLDAADVAAPLKPWQFTSQRIRSFFTAFHRDESVRYHRRALRVLAKVVWKAKNLTTYLVGQRLNELRDLVRMRLFRYHLDRGLRLPRALEQIPVRTLYLFAERDYRPSGQFDGELVLFRATDGEGPDQPYIERYDDPLFGWGRRATRGVRACDVPGGHSSMLQEPYVQALAERMQSFIDAALDAEPAPHLEPALAGPFSHAPES